MEKMECRGSISRIRECAFDILSMEEDLIDYEDDTASGEWWELMKRELQLKSTFLYCDLNRVITNAHDEHKETLTRLANGFFYHMEQLDNAVKSRDISSAQIHYGDAAVVLQELVVALMPP